MEGQVGKHGAFDRSAEPFLAPQMPHLAPREAPRRGPKGGQNEEERPRRAAPCPPSDEETTAIVFHAIRGWRRDSGVSGSVSARASSCLPPRKADTQPTGTPSYGWSDVPT